jgi:hypothetical protein
MQVLWRIAAVLVLSCAATTSAGGLAWAAAPVEDYVAGETGWFSDSAGAGLVALRSTIRPRGNKGASDQLGTLLVFCAPSEDKMIINISPQGAMRTTVPSGSGTAYLRRAGTSAGAADGRAITAAVKAFPGGSFEVTDLPTGERNAARAFVEDLAKGGTIYDFRLSILSDQSRFERDRLLRIDFRVTRQDKAVLQRFELACKLLSRSSLHARPRQGAIAAK